MSERPACIAVVRVRGSVGASPDARTTLENLRLTRNCHITLLDNRPSSLGMLKRAKNLVTWGEITEENIFRLLEKKGRLVGNRKLTDEYSQMIGYDTLAALAEAIYKSKVEFWNLPNIKPVFRGHPPKKGYKGKVKKSYTAGGVTGYRGQAINTLIEKMV